MSKHPDDDKLIDYAWGTLAPRESKVVQDHLRDCADCRAELARHQSLVGRVATTIPAMLPAVPPRLVVGWPAIAARIPRLRAATATRRRGSPGFVAVGLAMSAAALLVVAVTVQAWIELGRPPLTATALSASATPIASATYTPEHGPAIATPVSFLPPNGWSATLRAVQAPQARPLPIAATTRP